MAEVTLRQRKARIAKLRNSIEFWDAACARGEIGPVPADRARRILRKAEAELASATKGRK